MGDSGPQSGSATQTDLHEKFDLAGVPDTVARTPLGYWRVKTPPTADELKAYYAEKYYQKGLGSYELNYSEAELAHIRAKIELRWHSVVQRVPGPGRLLDVGCGEGFVLAHGHAKGWQVKGLDFSVAGLEAQNPACAPFLETGDLFELLERACATGVQYDVIWLQNVLEHVIDPKALMQTLHRLIHPEGVLVVTVPNDFSRLQHAALSGGQIDRAFWVALPDHLSYFTAPSLQTLGQATGWECPQILGDFPVDWFLLNDAANYIADPGKGKAAHHARVTLENLILDTSPDDATAFFEGLARIGMGRDLTALFTPTPHAETP